MPIIPNTIEALCVLLLEHQIAFDYETESVIINDPEAAEKTFISAKFSHKYQLVEVLLRKDGEKVSLPEAVRILAAYRPA